MHSITNPEIAYNAVRDLDPLGFDAHIEELVDLNTNGDTCGLESLYDAMLSTAVEIINDEPSLPEATATIRDLDFIASSVLRHGGSEQVLDPRTQKVFLDLSAASGTVPRGTVFTYAAENPDAERRRTYTGTPEENLFIESVSQGIRALDKSLDHVEASVHSGAEELDLANDGISIMVSSIVSVQRGLSPEFFTFEMRPYFEPLTIDGEIFAGPGGAQMQVVSLDNMLWGIDNKSDAYNSYYLDNRRYLTREHRDQIDRFGSLTDGKSIVTLLEAGDMPREAVQPTLRLLRSLKRFRYPHKKVADDNFALRGDGSLGSGQYTPTILSELIDYTEVAIRRLEEIDE